MKLEAATARRSTTYTSRGAMMLVCAAIAVATITVYARQWTPEVLLGAVLDGGTVLLWVGLCAALGFGLMRWVNLTAPGAMGFATAAALGLGATSLLAMGLALAGWLGAWTVPGLAVLAAAVGLVAFQPWRNPVEIPAAEWLRQPAGWHWLWALVVPFLAIAILGASIVPGFLWKPIDPHPYDVLAYHLQVPREWYEAGRMIPLPHNIYSHFPMATEMHFLMGMHLRGGPWQGMYLAQFLSLAFVVLSIIAIAGVARQMTGRTVPGIIAGTLVAIVPWLAMLGAVAYVEGAFLLYTILAVGWMWEGSGFGVRGSGPREISWKAMALAGVMAGLACGVKYTAVVAVLAAIVVVTAGMLIAARVMRGRAIELRRGLIGCILAGACGVAVFSPWMLRNVAWSGNPVFPMAMNLLGRDGLSEAQVERWDRAHRAADSQWGAAARLDALWRQVLGNWQSGFVVIPAGIIAGLVFWRRREMWFLGGLLLLQLLYWLTLTHLQGRFAVQIAALAALMLACALQDRPWGALGVTVLAAALGLAALTYDFAPRAALGRAGLLRLEDTRLLLSPDLAKALEEPSARLALIGDGRAFFYPIPMARLRYRIVFNVPAQPDDDALNHWLDHDLDTLRRDGYTVIIHPDELRRLAKTYRSVPLLKGQQASLGDEPIVLPPLR